MAKTNWEGIRLREGASRNRESGRLALNATATPHGR